MTGQSTYHAKDTELGMICGNYPLAGAMTNVHGGTMTAGTADTDSSALITWAPPFVSAPSVIVTVVSGMTTLSGEVAKVTGVGVSNCYVFLGEVGASGATVSIGCFGCQRL